MGRAVVPAVNDSTPPTAPTNLTATGALGRATLGWTAATDDIGVARYNVHRSTIAGFTPSAANRIAQPTGTSYVDTTAPAGTYFYKVTAEDAAGNVGPASNEASAVATADTTAPSVSITAPTDGATVSGTVSLTASAGDDVAVAGVQFKVDGANVGAEDTVAPYSFNWDSLSADERHAHADRGRPRRRRQPAHLRAGGGQRDQPAGRQLGPRRGLRLRGGRPARPSTTSRRRTTTARSTAPPGATAASSARRSRSTAPTTASTSPTPPRSTSRPDDARGVGQARPARRLAHRPAQGGRRRPGPTRMYGERLGRPPERPRQPRHRAVDAGPGLAARRTRGRTSR